MTMNPYYNTPAYLKQHEKMAHDAGIPALERLYELAQGVTHESYIAGLFLVGFYDGKRFPFNLSRLKELQPSNFMDCMLVMHLEFQARQEIYDYLELEVTDFEQMAFRILKIQKTRPIPKKVIIAGRTYQIDSAYIAGAVACLEKVASNPHRAFSKKNLQWQFGYDNERKGLHEVNGLDFSKFVPAIITLEDEISS